MANKLVLELVADSNNLLKAMAQAQTSINNFVKASDGAGSSLGSGVNRALSAFTGLASGGAVAAGVLAGALIATATAGIALALSAGHQAEQLQQLKTVTGIGTDTLQEYDVMLHRAGLGGEDLVQVMKRISTSFDQAIQGTGTAGDRFRQLGIDIRTVTSTDDLIRKVAGASNQFADGIEKSAIMSDLLGKGWATFIKAFGGGTQAMDEATAASERLGATLSGGQLAELAAMDDRVDDLTTAWTRFSQQLGSFVAPAIDFAARALSGLLAMASDALKALNSLGGVSSTAETRPKPPAMIDTAKIAQQHQALADAKLKATEELNKNLDALEAARFQNQEARLHAAAGFELANDVQIAQAHATSLALTDSLTIDSLATQLAAYDAYVAQKKTLFTNDAKGQADLAKFAVEASAKHLSLINQANVAVLKSDADRVTSARKTSDLMKQLEIQPYEDAVVAAKALDDAQHALFQDEAGLLGASDAARRVRFNLINEEAALQRAVIDQTIMDETRKAQAIQNLDLQTDTKRRQAVQAFPSFFESQMQSIVASNAFSLGSIVTTWTGAISTMILHGGNLKAAWEATQQAIIQSSLNALVQMGANIALSLLKNQAVQTASDTALLASHTAGEAARTAVTTAASAARTVIMITAAKVGGAAALAEVSAIGAASIGVLQAIVIGIAGVFEAMAAALAASIVGAPFAPGMAAAGLAAFAAGSTATAAAAAAVAAATAAATGILALAEGGVVTRPTLAMIGERGPEAVIPLSQMGGMGGGQTTIVIQLDGREIARNTLTHMPGVIYMKTGRA